MWGTGPRGFHWNIASPIHIHLNFGSVRFIPPFIHTPTLFFHFIIFSLLYAGLSALGAFTSHFLFSLLPFFLIFNLIIFKQQAEKMPVGWERGGKERKDEEMENGEKIYQARERQKSSLHMFLCWDSFSLPDLTFFIARNSISGFAKPKM